MAAPMPTRYLDYVQPKSRLAVWAWSPVIVLRVALVSTYLLYVYAAIVAFLVGIPIFALSTPEGWTTIWAVLLGVSALMAAIGSLHDKWQKVEKWATLVLSALLLAYIGGLNIAGFIDFDLARQFIGVVSLIAGVLPFTRFVYLAAQSGKSHAPGTR